MKDYKSLSKYEKLAYMQQSGGFNSKNERHELAVYLNALRIGNKEYVDHIESFGENPNKMLTNKRHFERGLLFGFSEFVINEHGWTDRIKLLDKETIQFYAKGQTVSFNSIDIARGLNNKWTFGTEYCTGSSGGSGSASIWGEVLETREMAIIEGLKKLISQHNDQRERLHKRDSCGNYNESYSLSIVKQVQNYLDELTGKKAVQLDLFA